MSSSSGELRGGPSGFELRRFPDHYFVSDIAYSALLVTPEFYEAFVDYRFILIYQLDSLVFADSLLDWCAKGYDYIGAPWFDVDFGAGFSVDFSEHPAVGNGGFSLRRVDAFLDVLASRRLWLDPAEYWAHVCSWSGRLRYAHIHQKVLGRSAYFNGVRSETRHWIEGTNTSRLCAGHEDLFWSLIAQHYLPGFRIAPADDALGFSFELHPQRCFELNGHKLPFGCHAWGKYDRTFWGPHLLRG
jgi:uncharacterized protein DUF5672